MQECSSQQRRTWSFLFAKLAVAVVIAICAVNRWAGTILSWLSLAVVLVCFTVVVQRYVFATSHIWMQDLYVWLNGAMFTGVAGYALLRNDHVRVDIFYRPAATLTKALIDLTGVVLFLLPFCWVVSVYAWPFIARSWRLQEASAIGGGMPGLFILKSFILVFSGLLALQGMAIALRSILVFAGREHLLPAELRYENNGSSH
ncbi:TRAP transporter small permease subunit [Rhodoligotrophos defluvii]|uniref:TRAP transporter small permease subunit n=1 Tax=Rhodoligotrophos defluvii TaxID=2561934 RepID=UPI0010C9BCE9|nr:TRAP transporter small permease subunit [Rhodoligotrophos defluvii]